MQIRKLEEINATLTARLKRLETQIEKLTVSTLEGR
jgi:hypothetical protein